MTQHQPLFRPPYAFGVLGLAMMLSLQAQAAPTGGVVAAGTAAIASSGSRTTITQTSQNTVINWQGFGIAAGESVQFVQPGSNAVALNRVLGPDPSAIFGNLSSNGKVFLVNPAGVLFGAGASVNVGGLVASTLNIGDADFMAGRYEFTGSGRGTVANHGTINAPGGYVALLGAEVSNDGAISARLGNVSLAGGQAMTLDVLGDKLLQVTVSRAAVDALVRNGGVIQADGGQVLLTTQAAGSLLSTAVNNTGIVQAQTISTHKGTIKLLGTMQAGTTNVGGTLDASAPNGGDGGFIETSAAHVQVLGGTQVTTLAASGRSGEWLIDPLNFTIGPGGNMTAAELTTALGAGNFTIDTAAMPGTEDGNITVDATVAVAWAGANTLTLRGTGKVDIKGTLSPTVGNLVVCCGKDVELSGTITATNGSVLLGSGGKVTLTSTSAITVTDGNLMICAANDISMAGEITVTSGSVIATESLGLPLGLTLRAGLGATATGVGGGTLVFAPTAAVTVNTAPALIEYSPADLNAPLAGFAANFANAVPTTEHMLVFANSAPKTFDGTTTATLLPALKGGPAGVSLSAPGPGAVANYDTAAVGANKAINFKGYTLVGDPAAVGKYALAEQCCGDFAGFNTTSGAIVAVALPPGGGAGGGVGGGFGGGGLPVVLGPEGDSPFADANALGVLSSVSFGSFLVSPLLVKGPALLTVAPVAAPPMQMVQVQPPGSVAPAAASPAAAAAPEAAPAAPAAAAPYRAPARPARPFRN